jgi:hypothetical protein
MSIAADTTRLVSRVCRVRGITRQGTAFCLDDVQRVTTDTHATSVITREHGPTTDPNDHFVLAVWEESTILYHDELKSITLVFDTPHHEYGGTR